MKADKNKEKTMTLFESALVINALAHLLSALANLIPLLRRRRK